MKFGSIKKASRKAVASVMALLFFVSIASTILASPIGYAASASLSLQQCTLYGSGTGLTAQVLASYTSVLQIHYDCNPSLIGSIHALDASYVGLVYRNLRKISSGCSEWATFQANNWDLKDANGNYVTSTAYGGRMVDIGNPNYQNWVAQWIQTQVTSHGYDGVFADDGFCAYTGEIWYDTSSQPINPRTGTSWTAQQVRDAYVGMLNAIRTKLGSSKLIVCNGIYTGQDWETRTAAYEYILDRTSINGLMGEGWWIVGTTWYSESCWQQSVDSIAQIESYFVKNSPTKMFIPVCYVDLDGNTPLPSGTSQTQMARYGFASTLLGIQSNRDYLCLTNNPTLLANYYKAMFSKNIGYPLGNYSVVSGTHVYQRQYSNALVLVNPTGTSYSVKINGTWTSLDGSSVSGTYTMAGHTGQVLLDPPTPPPPDPPPSSNWWNSAWQYRTSIAISHTRVSSDQSNFPLLVDITNPALTTEAQAKGQDFVFVDANNQKLDDQIESYNSSTGHLVAWVRIPLLSSTADTTITMYFGNPTCSDQQNPTGVWNSNYLMVQHLKETSGTQYDSTSNNNNGSPVGGIAEGVSGKIGGCDQFTGGYVSLPRVCTSQTQFTFSAWIYPQSGARYIISEWANNQGAFLQVTGDSAVQLYVNGAMAQLTVTLNQWHYVVGTYDGTTARLYLDGGSPASVSASSPTWGSQSMYIGDRYDHTRQFKGLIDEVRVSNIARSNSWIATEYTNQNNPSAFYTIGTQQSHS